VASAFMVKFNKNAFSLQPTGPVPIQAIASGASERCFLPLAPGDVEADLLGQQAVQVALKSSLGVAIFTIAMPLHALYAPDGRLDKTAYLNLWRAIQSEHYADVAPISVSTVPAATAKLEQSNVFSVAERNVSGQDFLYASAKLPDGTVILFELAFSGGAVKVCVKTEKEQFVPAAQASLKQLLSA